MENDREKILSQIADALVMLSKADKAMADAAISAQEAGEKELAFMARELGKKLHQASNSISKSFLNSWAIKNQ